jgi:hypothetical protein
LQLDIQWPNGHTGGMSEAEAPYEMVNLVPRMTGLPMTVWASPRGQARHDSS